MGVYFVISIEEIGFRRTFDFFLYFVFNKLVIKFIFVFSGLFIYVENYVVYILN